MKKITSILLSAVLLTGILAGCSNAETSSSSSSTPSPSSDTSSSQPAEKTKIVMATEAGFAPYEYYEGSTVVGVDVDIANEIAKALDAELVVSDMAFDAIIPSVVSGKADFAAAGMSVSEERKESVDFSIEYATSKQVIMVKNDSEIATPDDINGKTIGAQLGTVADIVVSDEMPEVKVQQYNKYMEAVQDLQNGRIDAIVMDSLPAEEIVAANEGLKILEEELFTDKYAIGVKKGNAELLEKINTVLEQLIKDGKIDEFTKNHLSK